jgi:hypothetical protein
VKKLGIKGNVVKEGVQEASVAIKQQAEKLKG